MSDEIRKVSQCVYLACNAEIAADISVKRKRIADAYDSNQESIAKQAEQIELLRGTLKLLMREAQACQDVLHSLAHNGQVCWDYSVDMKKALGSANFALSEYDKKYSDK